MNILRILFLIKIIIQILITWVLIPIGCFTNNRDMLIIAGVLMVSAASGLAGAMIYCDKE